MKKIVFILAFSLGLIAANAQYSTPRTGTGANNDNTFRALTFSYYKANDNAGADTVRLALNAYTTHITVPVLADSVCFNFSSVAKCYLGDVVKFSAIGVSGAKLKFVGNNFVASSNSIVLSSGLRCNISFIFDGVKWQETGRVAY
jgi:hypothetical protein